MRSGRDYTEKQIPHSACLCRQVRDDSRGSGEMFPATVPVLKSSHDPSTPRLALAERAREKASRCACLRRQARDDRFGGGGYVGPKGPTPKAAGQAQ
jgi:hypothetical protein